ncbi:MAG: histidine kinase dimerization/phosphoacceptor domain -containing protein [Methanoregula sp.]
MKYGISQQIHQYLENPSREKIKPVILAILTIIALVLTYISLDAGIEIVFTHFFYIPIILAAYWYRFRGIGYAILLSGFYLVADYLLTNGNIPALFAAIGRVIMFISIAIVIAILSEMISRQKQAILEKNSQLQESNRALEEKEKQLRLNLQKLADSERNLFSSREQLRLILESSAEGIFGIDRKGCITFINPSGSLILEYKKPLDLIGRNAGELVHPGNPDGSLRDLQDCSFFKTLQAGTTQMCDHDLFRHGDGTTFPVAFCSAPIIRDGTVEGAVISFEDITDRLNLLDQLKSSLKEKESLLKEIHHRVKNNLQIVISLLNMQSRYITDAKLLDIIQESQSRVRMMASVHERLYRSGDFSHIDMEDYLRFLTTNLFRSYGFPQSQVTSSVNIRGLVLDINTAIPLGLICNELISNSLKYAFPDGRHGEIAVTAESRPIGDIMLTIRDTGIGMPEGIDWQNADSLGLKLVNLFTDQLNGQISMRQDGGTTWEIIIPRST